jgi:hypothetical protein
VDSTLLATPSHPTVIKNSSAATSPNRSHQHSPMSRSHQQSARSPAVVGVSNMALHAMTISPSAVTFFFKPVG